LFDYCKNKWAIIKLYKINHTFVVQNKDFLPVSQILRLNRDFLIAGF